MITLFIIFAFIYVWRDVKDDYQMYIAALFCAGIITSEILTELSLIEMTGNFIGRFII